MVEGVRSPCEGHDAAEANAVTSHVRFNHHHVGDGHRDVPLQGVDSGRRSLAAVSRSVCRATGFRSRPGSTTFTRAVDL